MLIEGARFQFLQTEKVFRLIPLKHFCQTKLKSFASSAKKVFLKNICLQKTNKNILLDPKSCNSDSPAENFSLKVPDFSAQRETNLCVFLQNFFEPETFVCRGTFKCFIREPRPIGSILVVFRCQRELNYKYFGSFSLPARCD